MSDESAGESDHDAHLQVFDATDKLGRNIVSWGWADGRRTLSQAEHDEAEKLIAKAEARIDPETFDHGTILARIWMDGDTVEHIEWDIRQDM